MHKSDILGIIECCKMNIGHYSFATLVILHCVSTELHSSSCHTLLPMLVVTGENNRIELKVNISCNHNHKLTSLCCILAAVIIQMIFHPIDLCLLMLIDRNRDT